tara:strand:+ start:104 stop:2044 length:1941 start_codon:yes stop_codon:yes gene_type:complete
MIDFFKIVGERAKINDRLGQVAVFVIIAIVVVAGIVLFFAFGSDLFGERIPAEFAPIYGVYEGCIKQETENALRILGSQGGRIDVEIEEYEPGSDYAPFSSHLQFLGFNIPYWYYISGNNLVREKVPSKGDMEKEVEEFVEQRVGDCDFGEFYEQGFFVELGEAKVEVDILDGEVSVEVDSNLVSNIEDRSARKGRYSLNVDSKIGKFYKIARDVYDLERNTVFLENYAVDVLHNYAPVDGVEIQCAPKIWKTPEVVKEIKDGLQANLAAVKLEGSYYRLDDDLDDYFVQDTRDFGTGEVDEPVQFMFLQEDFPSKIEVSPASQSIMVAEPVGTQEGLGVMGFCYVQYHFVYDVSFPVLVQISDGIDVFQFPVSVVIDNNFPIETELQTLATGENFESVDACEFLVQDVTVKTFDANINAVEAEVRYNCFDSLCDLGKTELSGIDAVLDTKAPSCLNGFMIANADGYAEEKILFSSNSESYAEIFLDKEYEVEIELRLAGKTLSDKDIGVVHFTGEEGGVSAIIPGEKNVVLTEGLYDLSAFVYGSSGLVIPASSKTECFDTVSSGIAGFFGATKEKCVNVEFPEVKIENALKGGGKTTAFVLESDLQEGKIIIEVNELPKPDTLEQLQYNHEAFDSLNLQVIYDE